MKTKNVKAINLMIDDHFKLAGNLYRILSVSTNTWNEMAIRAMSLSDSNHSHIMLIVSKNTNFKIYNQS